MHSLSEKKEHTLPDRVNNSPYQSCSRSILESTGPAVQRPRSRSGSI